MMLSYQEKNILMISRYYEDNIVLTALSCYCEQTSFNDISRYYVENISF